MKIVVITQEEPFYLTGFMERLVAGLSEQIALIVALSPVGPRESTLEVARKFWILWGPRLFVVNVLRYAYFKVRDLFPVGQGGAFPSQRRLCRQKGIPYAAPQSLGNREFMARLRGVAPDLIISIAANQIFRRDLLELPRLACVNLHASLLPRYRGINPTFWVLANGEAETGVTVHFMDPKLDNGDIIVQKRIEIGADDTLHSLYVREMDAGLEAVFEAIRCFENGNVPRRPNEESQATYYSFPSREDVRRFRERGRRIR